MFGASPPSSLSHPLTWLTCSYGVSVTTLEEVFLRVANGTADVAARKEIAGIALQRQSSNSSSAMMQRQSSASSMMQAATAKVIRGHPTHHAVGR